MPDNLPAAGVRNAQSQAAYAALARIQDVLRLVQTGSIDERKAVQQIEEIASGAADQIVIHRPDLTT